MNKPVILNAGPLGKTTHPRPNREIALWLQQLLLAAQALEIGAMVATENVGHLSRFVEAKHWKGIVIEPEE